MSQESGDDNRRITHENDCEGKQPEVIIRDEREFESINIATESFVIAFYIAVAIKIVWWIYSSWSGGKDEEL